MAHKSPHMLWSAKTKSPVFERSLLTLHSVPICIRGEGLRVSESLQCDDPSECYAVGVQPSGYSGLEFPVRGSYAGVTDCTSSQSKTHSIESQEVRYRWHPWYGRAVWIHEDLEKHGEGIRRCRSENNVKARPLELPAWMFDEERCRSMEIRSAARVDCKALQRLKELLKQRKSQTGRDGVVEGQHRLGGADAEASKSLSTSTAGSISSHGEEAGLAKPTIGNSTKNAEAFGATVESTWRESAREQSKGGRR